MHVVMLTLLTAIAFAGEMQNKNLRLKQTNTLLLKTLKALTADEESSVGTNKGTVNVFNGAKGFGFIVEERSGMEYLFHVTGSVNFEEGDEVEFELIEGKKGGYNAVGVKKLTETAVGVDMILASIENMLKSDPKKKVYSDYFSGTWWGGDYMFREVTRGYCSEFDGWSPITDAEVCKTAVDTSKHHTYPDTYSGALNSETMVAGCVYVHAAGKSYIIIEQGSTPTSDRAGAMIGDSTYFCSQHGGSATPPDDDSWDYSTNE